MPAAIFDSLPQTAGLFLMALALLWFTRQIRNDLHYTSGLEGRVLKLERSLAREERRRYQVEAVLKAHGIDLPAWTLDPADVDDLLGNDEHPAPTSHHPPRSWRRR